MVDHNQSNDGRPDMDVVHERLLSQGSPSKSNSTVARGNNVNQSIGSSTMTGGTGSQSFQSQSLDFNKHKREKPEE